MLIKPKFSLRGPDHSGWSVFLPASSTNALIEFLRHKTAFTVDVGVFSKSQMDQPAQDLFVLPAKFTEEQVKAFITDFEADLV